MRTYPKTSAADYTIMRLKSSHKYIMSYQDQGFPHYMDVFIIYRHDFN